MLDAIKEFFSQQLEPTAQPAALEHQLQLATASLLIEMTLQDHQVSDTESRLVKSALQEKFSLSVDEVDEVFQLAQQEVEQSVDYYQFTKLIAEHFDQAAKIKIIELLWQVAYADDDLDSYEEHMVRRIADLIYVSHSNMMQAKHRVLGN